MVRIDTDPNAFKALVDTLLGSGSSMVRALMENDINTHQKLKGRLKDGDIKTLEYKDPDDSLQSIKLDDEESFEILAIQSFLEYSQNILGPKNVNKFGGDRGQKARGFVRVNTCHPSMVEPPLEARDLG
jgi:hypothetical protein